jgi:murein DD-endopeptidase MepM/ murein hydrolase activator NlpD
MIKRIALLWLALGGMALIVGAARQARAASIAPEITVEVRPTPIFPAQAGYVYVAGPYPLDVQGSINGQPLNFFWSGDGYVGLFAFDFDAPPGDYPIDVTVRQPGRVEPFVYQRALQMGESPYKEEYIALPLELTPLLDEEAEAVEAAQIQAVYDHMTPMTTWDWPYQLPIVDPIVTSPFGGERSYLDYQLKRRHTGTDLRRPGGSPVGATAAGRVAAVEAFQVHGLCVFLDHGWGVFSMYAHLSDAPVAVGDWVERGQVIGLVGSTGRSTAPHLHWEIAVNGIQVDPIEWMALMPGFERPPKVLYMPDGRELLQFPTPIPPPDY